MIFYYLRGFEGKKKKSKGGVSNIKKDQNAKGSSDIISTKKKFQNRNTFSNQCKQKIVIE